jgi:phosphoglycerate dehydrogenase-like enzyme
MAKLETLGITIVMDDRHVERLRSEFPEIKIIHETDLEKAPALMKDVDAMVGRARHINVMLEAENLRWMQTLTAGADAIPVDEVTRRNIVITNGSGIHAINLAEHILAFMLMFARGMPIMMRRQLNHEWNQQLQQFELEGQSLCVVGLGDIGLALAEKATALGMHVTGVKRRESPAPACVEKLVTFEGMDQLVNEADHVAITLPLTNDTRRMFDHKRLSAMKPGSYIYNIGRGEIIDQDALIEHLRSGHIAGAGLDVTVPEPLPEDSPLWDVENAIITSHTGGRSPKRIDRFMELLIDNLNRYRNDEPLRNIVDLKAGY